MSCRRPFFLYIGLLLFQSFSFLCAADEAKPVAPAHSPLAVAVNDAFTDPWNDEKAAAFQKACDQHVPGKVAAEVFVRKLLEEREAGNADNSVAKQRRGVIGEALGYRYLKVGHYDHLKEMIVKGPFVPAVCYPWYWPRGVVSALRDFLDPFKNDIEVLKVAWREVLKGYEGNNVEAGLKALVTRGLAPAFRDEEGRTAAAVCVGQDEHKRVKGWVEGLDAEQFFTGVGYATSKFVSTNVTPDDVSRIFDVVDKVALAAGVVPKVAVAIKVISVLARTGAPHLIRLARNGRDVWGGEGNYRARYEMLSYALRKWGRCSPPNLVERLAYATRYWKREEVVALISRLDSLPYDVLNSNSLDEPYAKQWRSIFDVWKTKGNTELRTQCQLVIPKMSSTQLAASDQYGGIIEWCGLEPSITDEQMVAGFVRPLANTLNDPVLFLSADKVLELSADTSWESIFNELETFKGATIFLHKFETLPIETCKGLVMHLLGRECLGQCIVLTSTDLGPTLQPLFRPTQTRPVAQAASAMAGAGSGSGGGGVVPEPKEEDLLQITARQLREAFLLSRQASRFATGDSSRVPEQLAGSLEGVRLLYELAQVSSPYLCSNIKIMVVIELAERLVDDGAFKVVRDDGITPLPFKERGDFIEGLCQQWLATDKLTPEQRAAFFMYWGKAYLRNGPRDTATTPKNQDAVRYLLRAVEFEHVGKGVYVRSLLQLAYMLKELKVDRSERFLGSIVHARSGDIELLRGSRTNYDIADALRQEARRVNDEGGYLDFVAEVARVVTANDRASLISGTLSYLRSSAARGAQTPSQRDRAAFIEKMRKAGVADSKQGEHMLEVARCYAKGTGVYQNLFKAVRRYQRAGELGHGDAADDLEKLGEVEGMSTLNKGHINLALALIAIERTPDDTAEIDDFLAKASAFGQEAGVWYARAKQHSLGLAAATSREDAAREKALLEEALAKAHELGDIDATYDFASMCNERGEVERAILLLESAAERGNTKAQFTVALLHSQQENYAAAEKYFWDAAVARHYGAQYFYAEMCVAQGMEPRMKSRVISWVRHLLDNVHKLKGDEVPEVTIEKMAGVLGGLCGAERK